MHDETYVHYGHPSNNGRPSQAARSAGSASSPQPAEADWARLGNFGRRFTHERLAALAQLLARLDARLATMQPMQRAALVCRVELAMAELTGMEHALAILEPGPADAQPAADLQSSATT